MKYFTRLFMMTFLALTLSMNVNASIDGDIDGSMNIDLRDAVTALQICAGMSASTNSYLDVDIDLQAEVNNNGIIDLSEVIFALQVTADLRTIWFKDADGDGYSDGNVLFGNTRPSSIYYLASELLATFGDENDSDAGDYPGAATDWVPFDQSAEPVDVSDSIVTTETVSQVQAAVTTPGMTVTDSANEGVVYQILKVSGCGYTSKVGKPQVPVYRSFIAVPNGATATATIVNSSYQTYENYYYNDIYKTSFTDSSFLRR